MAKPEKIREEKTLRWFSVSNWRSTIALPKENFAPKKYREKGMERQIKKFKKVPTAFFYLLIVKG